MNNISDIIKEGATLQLNMNTRLVYLGNGKARIERCYVNRRDKQSPDYGIETWRTDGDRADPVISLTAKQINAWEIKIVQEQEGLLP